MFGAHNPSSTAALLITDGAIYSPDELHARLSPESMLVLYQHNAPFWYPPAEIYTPMLWLAGEKDATTPEEAQWRSAGYYQADYRVIENAGHNLMMEHNYRQTAGLIHNWLIDQGIE
jgi:pimeloyl-ACP methyl ester carboxylesterase